MGLKDKLLGLMKVQQEPSNSYMFYEQKFTQSKSFKGSKKFHISFYGNKQAEDGIKAWRKAGSILDDAEIVLRKLVYDGDWYIQVHVNGFFIGSVILRNCNDEQLHFLKGFEKGHIVSVHINVEYENILGEGKRERFSLYLKADK